MTDSRSFDGRISSLLEELEAGTRYPDRLLTAAFEQTRKQRQARPVRWPASQIRRSWASLAAVGLAATAIVAAGALGLGLVVNQPGASPSPRATSDTAPSARPSAAAWATAPVVPAHDGLLLGWSRDGSLFLIQKDKENLWLLRADGTETQVTTQLTGISRFPGSSRPAGAAISPDGTRVVFAGLTKPVDQAVSCHDGGIFLIDAAGGPAQLVFSSRIAQNGIVRYPTFSPDGMKIAFADGYCDSSHHVWVMNADATDAHEVVLRDVPGDEYGLHLGGAHVYGLAWSVDGERLAVALDNAVLTFTLDGDDVTRGTGGVSYCWQGLACGASAP